MTGRWISVLFALLVVAVIAVITLTGHDNDPAGPPPTPDQPGEPPAMDPLADDAGSADPDSGQDESAPPIVAPTPAGDGPSSLLVTVVDEEGKAVAGAQLRILEIGKYKTGSFGGAAVDQILMGIAVVDKGADPPGKVGVTAGDGTCIFEGLTPAKYFVGVLASGHGPEKASAEVPEKGQAAVTVTVKPGAVLAGRVVDSRGNPVPGARVLACVWNDMTRLPYASMEMTESGSGGSFRFTSAVPEKRHILCARASDGRMAITVRIRAPQEDLLLKLTRRITLVGKVYEEGTGVAVEGAKLYAMLGAAESEEDGSYRLEGVAKSLFFRWVMIQKDGYQQKYHELDLATSMLGGSEVTVDFTIAKLIPGRLFISARDIDGTPLPGVAITVTRSGTEKLRARGITDTRGDLELADAPPHSSHLTAMKPGYVQVRVFDRPDGTRRTAVLPTQWVSVDPGGEATVEVVLARSAGARGIVRDQDGKPLEGVGVGGVTATDKDGRFELTKLPRGVPVEVGFTKDGFVPGHQTIEGGGKTEVEVTLYRGASISGRVLDPARTPIAKARVTLSRESGKQLIRASTSDFSDASGAFDFDELVPGRYVLEIRKKGFVRTKSRPIELPPGAAVKDIDLVVSPGLRTVVRVETAAGEQATAQVAIHGPLELPEAERIEVQGASSGHDRSGEFRLPPGRFRITAIPSASEEGAGAVEVTREVTGDGEVLVTLGSKPLFISATLPAVAQSGSLQLTRTDPPSPRLRLWAPKPSGGTIRSQALPPGKYRVIAYYSTDDSNSWTGKEFTDVEPGGPTLVVRED